MAQNTSREISYRESALQQAVITVSHQSEIDVDDVAKKVVATATQYERFLNRPASELDEHAAALAESLTEVMLQVDTAVTAVVDVEALRSAGSALTKYRAWKTSQEPF